MSAPPPGVDVSFPGGKRVSPEPFDLFLASLATCAGLYVLVFCQSRGVPTSQLRLDQEQIFEDGKLRRMVLRVLLPAGFPENHADSVRTAAAGCKARKSPHGSPEVEVIAVAAPPPAVPA